MPAKKYRVQLNVEERRELKDLVGVLYPGEYQVDWVVGG